MLCSVGTCSFFPSSNSLSVSGFMSCFLVWTDERSLLPQRSSFSVQKPDPIVLVSSWLDPSPAVYVSRTL